MSPPLIKNKINDDIKENTESNRTEPYINVSVQLTILTTAGNEIITVTVLYRDLLLWSKPTRYM